MNILAFDTTLGACSAAVAKTDGKARRIFGRYELRDRQHAETIIPMIEETLEESGLGWDALDAIAVTSGPGSFTGVRVGVATARGLALALDKPLIAATSLDVMARHACGELDLEKDAFAVAVDARRGEVYLAIYDADGAPVSEAIAATPNRAGNVVDEAGVSVVVGSGAPLLAGDGSRTSRLTDLQPDARILAAMAVDLPTIDGPLRPLYLRPPDAKPQDGKAVERQNQGS